MKGTRKVDNTDGEEEIKGGKNEGRKEARKEGYKTYTRKEGYMRGNDKGYRNESSGNKSLERKK